MAVSFHRAQRLDFADRTAARTISPWGGCQAGVSRISADRGSRPLGWVGVCHRSGWRQGIVVSGGKTLSRCHAGPGQTSANRGFFLRRPFLIDDDLCVCLSRQLQIDGHLSIWLSEMARTVANLGWHQSRLFQIGSNLGWRSSEPCFSVLRQGFMSNRPI